MCFPLRLCSWENGDMAAAACIMHIYAFFSSEGRMGRGCNKVLTQWNLRHVDFSSHLNGMLRSGDILSVVWWRNKSSM